MDNDKLTFGEGYQLALLHYLRVLSVVFAIAITLILAVNLFDAVQTHRMGMFWPSVLWLPVFYLVVYGLFRISTWAIRKTREDIRAMQDTPTAE